jgi:ankyrin repeat protein
MHNPHQDNVTLLHCIVNNDYTQFKQLLDKYSLTSNVEALLTSQLEGYPPVLLFASQEGRYEMVKDVLESEIVEVDQMFQSPTMKLSALHSAVHQGHLEVTKLLIQYGADVNLYQEEYEKKYENYTCYSTALQTAIYKYSIRDRVSIVQLLIDNGADVCAVKSIHGNEDFEGEIDSKFSTILLSATRTTICDGCDNDEKKITRLLVDAGAANNIVNYDICNTLYVKNYHNLYMIWYLHIGRYWPVVKLVWLGHMKNDGSMFSQLSKDVLQLMLEYIIGPKDYTEKLFANPTEFL